MNKPVEDVVDSDRTSVLGDLGDGTGDRTAIPIPITAITRCIQVCGVDADEETIAGLADNIDTFGLTHPVEVVPNSDDTWTLVKGNGRLLAHRRLGLPTILAFVDPRPLTETILAEVIQTQASENAHRKHLSILETLNTIDRLATPPCNRGRNAIGRIMHLPETTLKRYWRIYRAVRDRRPHWHPAVAAWLNTADATWAQATAFAADPDSQNTFAATGTLPDTTTTTTAEPAVAPLASPSADQHAPARPSPGSPPRPMPQGSAPKDALAVGGGPIGPPPTQTPSRVREFDRLWDQLVTVLSDLERLRNQLPASSGSRLYALLTAEAQRWRDEQREHTT
ncbi:MULTISPECIES: ParB N-terminal domain-containing protein [unclassified Crossiella]|uniref:ParB/RepB/Spo0J family partition protein n=1 Tax=unclassified Crossiella TaxID=2620835 RepID=UPI001FFFA589|nr:MULTISPECIES: ParB N-terminal domain-containing protein [unclassified Crossiella]MCK2240932.1 ParB N-terminal domain-containing protein [Crossiella sp. S99.2]MCK2253924.1 ParB N-terminal domain-containing protein [Crossiella sp. S99.1]